MGFPVAIHVVSARLGHLGAVETVQKTSGDFSHHGPVRDGLGHSVDGSLRRERHRSEPTTSKFSLIHPF